MSLFSALSVSSSGMTAQRTRAELLVENLANSETTRTPAGGPYRRKDAVFTTAEQDSPFSSVFQSEMGTGVRVDDILQDEREPGLISKGYDLVQCTLTFHFLFASSVRKVESQCLQSALS